MQLRDGQLLFSPSDVSGFLACPRLTQLEVGVARGERKRPVFDDPYADLIRAKGREHEAAYLARIESGNAHVVRIPSGDPAASAALTEDAIRSGKADIIYQAHLQDGAWRGIADFLERQSDGSYEPVETKLARAARPEHLLQLCFYAEQVGRIQGRLPERVHVAPGSGGRESFRTADYIAYYRRVRERFLTAVASVAPAYPWRCDHCPLCAWRRECKQKWIDDDSPLLVAGLSRLDTETLAKEGITTLAALGSLETEQRPDGINAARFDTLRHQAELQLEYRNTDKHRIDHLPDTPGRGFHLLPEHSPGDLYLDFEDHPFYEPARGLEYLFGYCSRDDAGALRYEAIWAKDPRSEKEAFETLVDRIVERRERYPGMHVYHYADHERSALRRLMGEHGTREDEIDTFLSEAVFVDLFRVTRQALRASVDSYSIKDLEALYGFRREEEALGGGVSAVLFDQWLEIGDDEMLEKVRRYNEDDCRSAAALHEWLLARRPDGMPWRPAPEPRERTEEKVLELAEREKVQRDLSQRSSGEGDPAWLLGQLLDYHEREAKPQWWEWFHNQELDDDELIESTTTLGGLTLVGDPVPDKKSLIYTFSFPEQDHKIRDKACDPETGKAYEVRVDDERGVLVLRRARERAEEPLPRGLIPTGPIDDAQQRAALMRFARSYLADDRRYAALTAVLERDVPRAALDRDVPDAALSLDGSHLVVQGPPGTGKTWQGAKAAVALMRAGRRIGVTSLSHKAIDNLLNGIEREAAEQGFRFRGRKKHTKDESVYSGHCIQSSGDNKDLLDPDLRLIAGTVWLFARKEFDQTVDTLFIDEAGQVSLADTLAGGTAARNLVFLGDPNQLPQVSQGAQPAEAKASGLRHLLGTHQTVPPHLGKFLGKSWRLRPEPCAFTSEAYYEGRLTSAPSSARRDLAAGNGLALLPVDHEGCGQSSREEVEAVRRAIEELLGTAFTEENGVTRPLTPNDILVVAPYNAQVRALQGRVPAGVRVGTVDKFQGQEAAVVLVSFASSSGADAPRGIQFAFDRHRVNVATSRAQCRVVIVCAPRLLEAECRTIEQMRLMNAVCRFVELAEARDARPAIAPKSAESKSQIALF
jgi:uncharacterized protein